MRKMYILKSFASEGVRYTKGTISKVKVSKIERFKKEGFVEDVSVALGVECEGDIDLSNYVTLSQLEEMKPSLKGEKGDKGDTGATGLKGADGYPSKEQWDELVNRVVQLESLLGSKTEVEPVATKSSRVAKKKN